MLRFFIFRPDSEYTQYSPESWEVVLPRLSASSLVYSISNIEARIPQESRAVKKWTGWGNLSETGEQSEMFPLGSQEVKAKERKIF